SQIIDEVLPRYEVVIVDTPPSLNEVVLTALDRSDLVPVLATLDVPSLRNLTAFLSTLRRLRIDDGAVKLILNNVEDDVGISVRQAQESFDGRFVGVIPSARSVSRSINMGEPLTAGDLRYPVSRALADAVQRIYPDELVAPGPSGPPKWSFRRLFRSLSRVG